MNAERQAKHMNRKGNALSAQTEEAIHEALFSLLEKKASEKISVSDICAEAAINRSTFYRHYLDINDLMEQVEFSIWRKFRASFSAALPPVRFSAYGGFESREVLTEILRHVQKYAVFYRAYLRDHSDVFLEQGFQSVWEERLVPMFRAHGVTQERHMRYYYRYSEAGFRTSVRCWLEDGCPESPEELSELLWRVRYAISAGAGRSGHEEG